jgi:peptide deformylase
MPVKVFAMRVDDSDHAIVCFNPEIIKESDGTVMMKEGCLSFPSLYLNISRPIEIEAQYQNADGDMINVHFEGLAARIFHHEMDHMKGETFINKVNKVFLQSARRKQKKLLRKGRRDGRAS